MCIQYSVYLRVLKNKGQVSKKSFGHGPFHLKNMRLEINVVLDCNNECFLHDYRISVVNY